VKVRRAVVVASAIISLAVLFSPASASAASPVLEFMPHGGRLPISFTTEGGPVIAELAGFARVVHCTGSAGDGEITGPRSTVSKYKFTGCVAQTGSAVEAECKSEGAEPEEIRTGPIAAELVYLDQTKREVGILLNPGGGTYMSFKCGGQLTEARGPFLSSITPINEEASSFTTKLTESNAVQTPDEYESATGEKLKATPEGNRGGTGWVTTGVAAAITVHPSAPVEIRALPTSEVEAKQHEAEARQREEETTAAAAAKKQQEEATAANKKRGEEEALAALKSALRLAVTADGKAPKVGALLKHGGLTLAISSSEPGTLVIQWWQVPPGAHLAKKGELKPVLVAHGEARFTGTGASKVKIDLTRTGRRLLAHANKLKLTSRARFTPLAQPAISATGLLVLRR
jgi:hypothetical protein